jgi:hypothetical protein
MFDAPSRTPANVARAAIAERSAEAADKGARHGSNAEISHKKIPLQQQTRKS